MSKKYHNFTLGADPEAFLFDSQLQKYIPSSQFFSGEKDNPEDLGNGYKVLCDNFMVEFNIPPASSKIDFVQNLITAINLITTRLPDNVNLVFTPMAIFKSEYLNDPTSRMFGCAPQKNLYDQVLSTPEELPETLRFAGGHIHFGTTEHIADLPRLVKLFDLFIGLDMFLEGEPSYNIGNNSYTRSMIYGAPGTYRVTNYGFEYRTPSNIWLANEDRIAWIYQRASLAYTLYQDRDIDIPEEKEIWIAFQNKEAALELKKELYIGVE